VPRTIADAKVESIIVQESQPSTATRWSTRGMARLSGISSVGRIWRAFAHRLETFKLSSDPMFVDKVRDIVGLYLNPPDRALALCVDEKSQIQALERTQPRADKAYDAAGFVAALRERNATPHVAQNTSNRRSVIDGRTTRHPGYTISGRRRKRIEEIFGWTKAAGLRKTRHRGVARVGWIFSLTVTAYNLVRLPKLSGAAA
jgi:hypothetical protein